MWPVFGMVVLMQEEEESASEMEISSYSTIFTLKLEYRRPHGTTEVANSHAFCFKSWTS